MYDFLWKYSLLQMSQMAVIAYHIYNDQFPKAGENGQNVAFLSDPGPIIVYWLTDWLTD